MPLRLRCPRPWLRTIAGKSTCDGSVAFLWEVHPKGGYMMGSNDLVVGEDHMLVHLYIYIIIRDNVTYEGFRVLDYL